MPTHVRVGPGSRATGSGAVWACVAGIVVGVVCALRTGGPAALLGVLDMAVLGLGYSTAAGLVLAARPGHRIGQLLLVAAAVSVVGVLSGGLSTVGEAAAAVNLVVSWPLYAFLSVLLLVLPRGHLLGPRWRPVLVVALVGMTLPTLAAALAVVLAPEMLRDPEAPAAARGLVITLSLTGFTATGVALLGGITALVVRGRRRARNRESAGRILALLGLAPVLGLLLDIAGVPAAYLLGSVAFPLGVVAAGLRHRMLDVDLVLDRAVLWLGTTVLLLGGFLGIVWFVSWGILSPPWETTAPVALAALATALLVAPLHRWLRRALYRGLYGRSREPDVALATLDGRVDAADRDGVLGAAAAAIAESLALPYVAVEVGSGDETRRAEYGRPAADPVRLPLVSRGDEVGAVEVSARSRRERLSDGERSIIVVLARAAVTTARSVALADSLQNAREALVNAREEERLRLRRDLHDGVSPTLAGVRLLARALEREHDPSTVHALLDAARTASDEVTRVVDGLRPPALDVGLAAALGQLAEHLPGGPVIHVDAEDGTPLSPAVEVALFRIASEALANVVKHAHATSCALRLEPHGDHVTLTVTDDGSGVRPSQGRVGVGLASMRTRAEELGGSCRVDIPPGGGTRVHVRLPLVAAGIPPQRSAPADRVVTTVG